MADEKKPPQPLGRILLRQKLISQNDLDSALSDQAGTPLASRLIERGLVSEVDALRALSEQHGVPGIELSQVAILLEHLVVPREVAEAHKILPVLVKGDRVFLAMADPSDKRVIDELEFVTGKKVYPYVALTAALMKAIESAYDAKSQNEIYFLGPNVTQETLKRLGLSDRNDTGQAPSSESSFLEPRPVMDEQMHTTLSGELQMVPSDVGNVTTEDSTIAQLPPELRVPRQEPSSQPQPEASGKLVLVVDDEEEIRKMLKRLLVGKGHRVIEADRGLVALRMVKEHVPDLIILDAMLPEVHGFDIARRIKGSDKYGKIPIIMISAVYRGWRIAEDLKASYGISAYLEKPFKIADVVSAVARALADEAPVSEVERDMSAEAEKALADGIAAYKANKPDDAIAILKQGVAIDPLAFRLRFQLGLLYGKRGMVYEGIQELEKSVEISPKHFAALKNLAILYEKAGFRHRAVEVWERTVRVAPDDATKTQIKEHLLGLL